MRVLFKCKGNICRSPAAEAYLRSVEPLWPICSVATTINTIGQVFHPKMREACEGRGIATTARPVIWEGVYENDYEKHYDRVYDLHKLGIQDPYVTGDFEGALDEIIKFIDENVRSE